MNSNRNGKQKMRQKRMGERQLWLPLFSIIRDIVWPLGWIGQNIGNSSKNMKTPSSYFSPLQIKIGHIGAIAALPSYEKVKWMERMIKDHLPCHSGSWSLSHGIDQRRSSRSRFRCRVCLITYIFNHIEEIIIRIINKNGCGESFEGVAAAADMYHVDGVKAFLGPYCNSGEILSPTISTVLLFSEIIPVATMATFWNVPIIAYMQTANALSDKSVYKTLVRVSIRSDYTYSFFRFPSISDSSGIPGYS